MRAISLWQPWATAMALGLKKNETRGWRTSYRGPLVIHAAKRWTRDERDWAGGIAHLLGAPELRNPPLGVIVCIVRLIDCVPTDKLADIGADEELLGNYGPGRFAWITSDVVRLPEPIPYRGAQGFFDIPDALLGAAALPFARDRMGLFA